MARPKNPWSTVSIKPLTGGLDTRSSPEDVPLGIARWLLNFWLTPSLKLCRANGFSRFLSGSTSNVTDPPFYLNADWHDQEQGQKQTEGDFTKYRQAPTMLFEAGVNTGQRYIYAATQTQIAWLNDQSGLWTILTNPNGKFLSNYWLDNTGIGVPMGGPFLGQPIVKPPAVAQTRFHAAELQNTILFTNNVDLPIYTVLTSTSPSSTAQTVDSLISEKVFAAGGVVEYNGCLFLFNTVEGAPAPTGQRIGSRIRWSDLNNPLEWTPGGSSIADFQDLDYGETILAAAPLGPNLYLFTTRAIWICSVNTATTGAAFVFTKLYSEPDNQAGCLAYPNTLVSTGTALYYCAQDGIYYLDLFLTAPERLEWLYKASSVVFTDSMTAFDPACCQSLIMTCRPDDFEIYLSFPSLAGSSQSPCLNDTTLVFNYRNRAAYVMDAGWTSMVNFRQTPGDLNGDQCNQPQLLVGASSFDLCLKTMEQDYSRQIVTNPAVTGGGSVDIHGNITGTSIKWLGGGLYVPFLEVTKYVGYNSVIRGLLPLTQYDREKQIRNFLLEIEAQAQAVPCVVRLRVGDNYSNVDPNTPDGLPCAVIWHRMPDMPIKCLDELTNTQYADQNLYRAEGTEWAMLQAGRFLFFELTITNADHTPAMGGACCFNRIECQIRLTPAT